MANPAWTFEGTTGAQLQAIHDGLVAYLGGGEVGKGLQAYTMKARSVTKIDLKSAADLLSAVSNELARRALPDRDEFYLSSFGDDGGDCGPRWRP